MIHFGSYIRVFKMNNDTTALWDEWLSRCSDWVRAGRSRDRIPVGGEIFRTCPDRPRGPSSFLCNGYRVFTGGKERPGRDVDHPPPSSAEVKERVKLYIYSPSRSSWPVLGRTLPLPFHFIHGIAHGQDWWAGWHSRYSDCLRAGRSGD